MSFHLFWLYHPKVWDSNIKNHYQTRTRKFHLNDTVDFFDLIVFGWEWVWSEYFIPNWGLQAIFVWLLIFFLSKFLVKFKNQQIDMNLKNNFTFPFRFFRLHLIFLYRIFWGWNIQFVSLIYCLRNLFSIEFSIFRERFETLME